MSGVGAESLLGEEPFRFGDAVTHRERGLAEIVGLSPSPTGEGELIRLRFRDDEDVLLPTDEAGQLYEYGAPARFVSLDDADGDWSSVKEETEAALAKTAEAVIEATARRRVTEAPIIEAPEKAIEAAVAGFDHALTPDQAAALDAVLGDLAAGSPMDRVLVADVGFGKTEVALRAAAVAVAAGYQVAVAAPTTVLCRQHAALFERRLAPMDAAVMRLSGLETDAEAEAVRDATAQGEADVVVGTHALTSEGVSFAKLGLLIIDEEQRFGSEQKKTLRALGAEAHVLVLTATPIPRTLAAAEAGLRDLSLIRTPPEARRPVRTEIGKMSDKILHEALTVEAERGGQAFVVCPRIAQIDALSRRLSDLLPKLRLAIAHGELPTSEVEAAMEAFGEGEADVLLSTAIIESGVDVPNANTMLIMDPDRFGLAQLHQLRGRIGRGDRQAHLWLLTASEVSDEAAHRLETLARLSDLGAGFAVSAKDLGQRGAGELFGEEQTGHLDRVGLGLTRDLMAKALAEASGEPVPAGTPDIGACAGGFLPEDYVPEAIERFRLYVRIERATGKAAAEAVAAQMADRYGPLPRAARMLIDGALLRGRCARAGVAAVDAGSGGIAVTFEPDRREAEVTGARVAACEERFGAANWSKGRLVWPLWEDAGDPCEAARALLGVLADD